MRPISAELIALFSVYNVHAPSMPPTCAHTKCGQSVDCSRYSEKQREERIREKEKKRREKQEAMDKEAKAKCRNSEAQGSKYSKGDVLLLKQIFDSYDDDGSGSISVKELREV